MINKTLTVVLLFISAISSSQIPDEFPSIGKDDIPGAKSLAERKFTGAALFGYMNGGAELYLEYGIYEARITEFDIKNSHYKCEIFKMKGKEEAFGIFSVSKFKCLGMPPFEKYTCQTKYQLQICKGPYYISIINSAGTVQDSLVSIMAGKLIAERIKEPSVDLASFFPGTDTAVIKSNAVLAMGKLGLMNGATEWEDYFKDLKGYCVVILPSGDKTLISARFDSNDEFRKFCSLHNIDTDRVSGSEVRLSSGEVVSHIKDNHLLIRSGF